MLTWQNPTLDSPGPNTSDGTYGVVGREEKLGGKLGGGQLEGAAFADSVGAFCFNICRRFSRQLRQWFVKLIDLDQSVLLTVVWEGLERQKVGLYADGKREEWGKWTAGALE